MTGARLRRHGKGKHSHYSAVQCPSVGYSAGPFHPRVSDTLPVMHAGRAYRLTVVPTREPSAQPGVQVPVVGPLAG